MAQAIFPDPNDALPAPAVGAPVVLAGTGLVRRYGGTLALDDVSVALARGEALAVIGESGSGKSTLARLLLRLERPDRGAILLHGTPAAALDERAFRRRVQLVFQDPYASLDPTKTVAAHLERPLVALAGVAAADVAGRARALLTDVGLAPELFDRRPHELSGGQRQRVAIARALAAAPEVLVADEPTSMLDVSVRVGVLDVFAQKKAQGLALLLITHDLAAAARVADRVMVLFRGRVVEEGPFARVLHAPAHPYTRALVDALERLDPPAPPALPDADGAHGCNYVTRCPHAEPACAAQAPPLVAIGDGRSARCWRVDVLGAAPHAPSAAPPLVSASPSASPSPSTSASARSS